MEQIFGGDHYFVHFNRQPGIADAVLEENTAQFLTNLYRKKLTGWRATTWDGND
ncbi:hypothetical protein QW180_23310 [Vibrio sinaloensis]|nr:hypothetical protein [Vibrio sinaloensis]